MKQLQYQYLELEQQIDKIKLGNKKRLNDVNGVLLSFLFSFVNLIYVLMLIFSYNDLIKIINYKIVASCIAALLLTTTLLGITNTLKIYRIDKKNNKIELLKTN